MTTSTTFPRTGVAYIAQIENEHMGADENGLCNNCLASGKEKQLKRCTGCKLANYCSRECQKKQWSKHKDFCALVQGKGTRADYLSSLDQSKAYRVLIDSYRLRVENDHKYRDEDHGIYYPGHWVEGAVWVRGDALADFQRYLDLAEDSGVLPPWWSFTERMECLSEAVDRKREGNIFEEINVQQLIVSYGGDLTSQFVLRIIAELIVGYDGKGSPVDDSSFHMLQASLAPDDEQSTIKKETASSEREPDEEDEEKDDDIPLRTS